MHYCRGAIRGAVTGAVNTQQQQTGTREQQQVQMQMPGVISAMAITMVVAGASDDNASIATFGVQLLVTADVNGK
jgi:hypothetical protein